MKIRATVVSLGGLVLLGIMLVMAALAWIQPGVFTFLFLAVAIYMIDAWSENLTFENGIVTFDSILRPKHRVNACAMAEVTIVHEGLNQERGIVSVVFREPNGRAHRISLGPLWHRHTLEAFFRTVEKQTGECVLL